MMKRTILLISAVILLMSLASCTVVNDAFVDFAVDAATASAEINAAMAEEAGDIFVMPEDQQTLAYTRDLIQFETDTSSAEMLDLYTDTYGEPIGTTAEDNPIFDHPLFGRFQLVLEDGEFKATRVSISPHIPEQE